MKKLKNKTTFNESTDGYTPVVPGTYPANVKSMEIRNFEDSGRKLFKIQFLVSDEVKSLTVNKMTREEDEIHFKPVLDGDGNNIKVSANYLAGKVFYSKGIWLTPNPKEGEGWRNRAYKEFMENLGVTWETNGNGDTILGEVEENDILGQPCMVRVVEEKYEKDGVDKIALKVGRAMPWTEGKAISPEELKAEDIPF
tara:strand:+ start:596 stop:1186 length:591 start_codon:yes stop_codon:yes gene_type:complete